MVERPPILDRVHDVLVLLLVALRPWCWDGMPGQPADMVWQGLAVAALLIVALERVSGLRQAWAWSWRGVIAVALMLALLPTVLGAVDPAPAWCQWGTWVACLAAAAYLMQVLGGRQRMALAALLAGLSLTAIFAVTQQIVVLPALAQAQQSGSSVFSAMGVDGAAAAERIAHGGVFATFTLANQLGAYLALLLPLGIGVAWTTAGWRRWLACGVSAVGALALYYAHAKGAWIALAGGAGLAWWLAWRGHWWRWLPLPLGMAAVVVLASSGAANASSQVRLGYWRTAVALANEAPVTGHGLGGYEAHASRLMLPGDEPTRYVHNEVLEAAVAGGWGLAALMLAALVALAWPRRAAIEPATIPAPPRGVVWALVVAVPYLAVLGAFNGNLGGWPGGENPAIELAWSMPLAAVVGVVAVAMWRVSPPPAWAWAAGLLAVALKALIDFDFHAGGVIGTALLVAVCANAPLRLASGAAGRLLPLLLALAAGVVVVVGMRTALRLSEAHDWLVVARQCSDAPFARDMAVRLDLDPATPPPQVAAAAAERAWQAAAGASGLRQQALDLMPTSHQTLDRARALADSAPHSAAIAVRHARLLAMAGELSAATAEADRALALAPHAPRMLDLAAEVLERTAPGRAAALRAEAARLRPLVHPAMR